MILYPIPIRIICCCIISATMSHHNIVQFNCIVFMCVYNLPCRIIGFCSRCEKLKTIRSCLYRFYFTHTNNIMLYILISWWIRFKFFLDRSDVSASMWLFIYSYDAYRFRCIRNVPKVSRRNFLDWTFYVDGTLNASFHFLPLAVRLSKRGQRMKLPINCENREIYRIIQGNLSIF